MTSKKSSRQTSAKDDIDELLFAEAPAKDIESVSYDIARYAFHEYPLDNSVRKFRLYIEGKIKQYIKHIKT